MKAVSHIKLLILLIISPVTFWAQEVVVPQNNSVFSNPLFLILLTVIILLLIVILAFSSAFKNLAESNFLVEKFKKDKNTSIKNTLLLISFFIACSLKAQTNNNASSTIGGLESFTFFFMLSIIFIELLFLGVLIYQFNYLIKDKVITEVKPIKINETKLIKSLTDAVPVEEEESILLDHDYDGIQELDNNLPPWWKYGFYCTIVFAFIYLISYHVIGIGSLQEKEYKTEILKAKLEVEEFMKNSANNVDENTVVQLKDANSLESGKEIFMSNCAVCHGKLGEGTVGPNLTDNYWLHGGSVKDIFKTIKYGWVEKGMKSWKEDLSPIQTAQVTSYLRTLIGTNPPKQKAAQGDLFVEKDSINTNDTLKQSGSDTLKIKLPIDSLSK